MPRRGARRHPLKGIEERAPRAPQPIPTSYFATNSHAIPVARYVALVDRPVQGGFTPGQRGHFGDRDRVIPSGV